MSDDASTMSAVATTYVHESLSGKSYRRYIAAGKKSGALHLFLTTRALYDQVEYLNSPAGLIVLAHHDTIDGQVDGIHPASLSSSIDRSWNIIEPLQCGQSKPDYNTHYMGRKSQGALVLAAFGRMIHAGDAEAPNMRTDRHFSLQFFSAPSGPIVGVIEFGTDTVHVIKPAGLTSEMKEVA